jgi:hypothetical protein
MSDERNVEHLTRQAVALFTGAPIDPADVEAVREGLDWIVPGMADELGLPEARCREILHAAIDARVPTTTTNTDPRGKA